MEFIGEECGATREKGFTLLELLISTVILAIGLLGVAALQTVAIKGNVDGKNFTLASTLIADKIDELRNGPFADINSQVDYITFDNKMPQMQTSKPNGGFYMTRSTIASSGPDGTRRVRVEVRWEGRAGVSRSSEFETLIAN